MPEHGLSLSTDYRVRLILHPVKDSRKQGRVIRARLIPEVHLFIEKVQSFAMDEKHQQTPRVKHDCPICEQCQAASIKIRPDGSYVCNRCGYNSATGKKK